MNRMPPIVVAHLFRELAQELHLLLGSLSAAEWELPTSSSDRSVKDVASHLLDGSLRRLSMQRDGYIGKGPANQPGPEESLLEFLNRLNREWDVATRRLSPQVVVDLLDWSSGQVADLFESLDPFAPAICPVAWAGEEQSPNWMDIAREYTEKWHHTRQIFEAAGRPSTIDTPRLFYPCLETFMRALPYTLRASPAMAGSEVAVTITGPAGGTWFAAKRADGWQQQSESTGNIAAHVTVDQVSFWKLVTKRRTREQTLQQFPQIEIRGDQQLGNAVMDMVAMMA